MLVVALLFGTLWKLFLRLKNDTFAEDNERPVPAPASCVGLVPAGFAVLFDMLDDEGRHC